MPPPDGTPPPTRSSGPRSGPRPGNGHDERSRLSLPPEPGPPTRVVFPWSFLAIFAFLVCMAMYAWLWVGGGAPVGAALPTIPVLLALTAPILVYAARTERRFDLAGLLALGLLLRFIATYYRFDHAVDARTYNLWGTRLADSFRDLNFAPDTGASVPGSGSMRYISGLAHLLSNDDELGAFLILTWFAFLGCYLLYRAFVTAVPDGNRHRYACLLFFWPSVVLWPSSIGKEAVLFFAIGLTAFGAARLFTRRPGGYALLFLGILLTYLVRPHVALIMLVALGFALIVGRGHPRPTRALTPASIAKVAAIVLLLAAMSVVASRTANYLGIDNLQPTTTEEAFQETQQKTAQGGSEFTPPDATNPIGYWQAAVTLLFRPFPFEATASDQLATAFEALGLAGLIALSWRRLLSVPWRLRVQPYVGFALAFVLMFFFVFAAISNFGIIARERTMMLPFVFVLLSVTAVSASSAVRSPTGSLRRAAQPVRARR